MRVGWFLSLFVVAAVACLPANAQTTIKLDNGLNSGNMEWDALGYQVSVNVFPTPAAVLSGAQSIDQVEVAWGDQLGSGTVAIFSLANGYQLPHHPVPSIDTSNIAVLQSFPVTVTSGGTNAYIQWYPPGGGNPPPPTVFYTPTWTTYNIPATAITTNYFAVETIQKGDPNYVLPAPVEDCVTALPENGSQGYSWFADSDNPIPANLAGLAQNMPGNNGDNSPGWVEDWMDNAGYSNFPFLLRAATAATPVWQNAVSGNWSDGTKWATGVVPSGGTGAVINAPTNAQLTVTLNQPVTLATLQLGNSSSTSVGYTLSGTGANTLTFSNSGGGAMITVTGGSHVIGAPVVLADNLTVSNSGTLTFGPGSSITNNGSGDLTLLGPGSVVLSVSNAFTGATHLGAGGPALVIANPLALQNSTLGTGLYSNNGAVGFGTCSTVTLGGLEGDTSSAQAISLRNSNGQPVTLSIGNNNANSTFSGGLVGSGGIVKIGTGALLLAGNNAYAGATAVTSGTLQINNPLATISGSVATGTELVVQSGNGVTGWSAAQVGSLLTPSNFTWGANSVLGIDTTNGNFRLFRF